MYFFDNIDIYKNNVAGVSPDGSQMTYGELDNIASGIKEVIPARTIVFVLCKNTLGSMASYISCLKNRIVPLMLDAQIDSVLLENLLDLYKPAYILLPLENESQFENCEKVFSYADYSVLKTDAQSYEVYDELGLLLCTSGSTGSPKLVRQSYKNIQSNTDSIVEYLKITESEKAITTLPMNYTYGISVINTHIAVGATMLLTTETIVSAGFWKFFKEQEVTSFAGVPYTYEMLKRVRFYKMDLPSLRYFTQAGGKLSPELHSEYAALAAERNKEFIVMYGQTEATARMGYLPAQKAIEKRGSMGIVIPGGRFDLIDENGNVITEIDKVGELVYYGENVTLGYAETLEDLAKGDELNGRLETGDMAKRDEDGFYYIVGRKKRFLKLFGNRINLDEIDRIVKREFPSCDVASDGNDDGLVIYVTDDSLREQIHDVVCERTHINTRAVRVVFIDEIPRNESGKVLYKNLKNI